MPIIDLTEIPEAHVASGQQDSFELFAADLLQVMGYEITRRPGRGADLGKDLIVTERRKGIVGETIIRWLVSCKHKAQSQRSVGLDDELNLMERVQGHQCNGFIGCYSTVASESLLQRLNQLTSHFEYQVLDRAVIEKALLQSQQGIDLARRYCPTSIESWTKENPRLVAMFEDEHSLFCEMCGRDLLDPPQGIYCIWQAVKGHQLGKEYVDVHWACKGLCDKVVTARVRAKHDQEVVDGWNDIPDYCTPVVYIKWFMRLINGLHAGDQWSEPAFEKIKTLALTAYQRVARQTTTAEHSRVVELCSLPSYMGGLGYSE